VCYNIKEPDIIKYYNIYKFLLQALYILSLHKPLNISA